MDRKVIRAKAAELVGIISMGMTDSDIELKVKEISDELKRCSKCNRPLVVPQHLDYYPSDVCGRCQG